MSNKYQTNERGKGNFSAQNHRHKHCRPPICRTRRLLLPLVSALLILLFTGQTPDSNRIHQLLREAQHLLDSARYDDALSQSQAAFDLAPAGSALAAHCLLQLGDVFAARGDWEAAAQQYQTALDFLNQQPAADKLLTALAINGLGEVYYKNKNYPQAGQYFKQTLLLRQTQLGENHPLIAAAYNNLGNCALEAGQYVEALALHQKALSIRRQTLPPGHPDLATSHNNLGNCFLIMGDPAAALPAFEEALQIRQQIYGPDHPKTAQVLGNLGNCLSALGHRTKAAQHYRRALDIRRRALGNWHPDLVPALENIGDCCFEGGDFIEALDYFRQALFVAENYTRAGREAAMATLWHKIGLCYQYEGDYQRALDLHLRAAASWPAVFGPQHPSIGGLWNNIGNCYAEQKKWKQAVVYYRRAAQIYQDRQLQSAGISTDLSLIYNNLGLCSLEGQPSNALSFFKQSAQHLPPYPTVEKANCLKNQALALSRLGQWPAALVALEQALQCAASIDAFSQMEVLATRGTLFCQRGIRLRSPQMLREAVAGFANALHLSDSLRLGLSAPASRQRWTERQYPVLQSAVEAAFNLWKMTGETAVLEQAFAWAERNRGLQLLDNLRHEQAQQFAGIPDSLLEKERWWGEALNQREKYRLALLTTQDSSEIQLAEQGIAEARQQLAALSRQMEHLSPDYFRLRYAAGTATPAAIREAVLKETNSALVEYFHTDSAWYAFVLTPGDLYGIRLPVDTLLEKQVQAFRRSVEAYPSASGPQVPILSETYARTAFALYQQTIEPLQTLVHLPETLVIIPDGILSYLPFEALLCELPTHFQQFKTHHYLLRDFQISYANSATQLTALLATPGKHAPRQLLAMAPSFDDKRYPFSPLAHNQPEATALSKLLRGELRIGKRATIQSFEELAPKYRILHLATHGYASAAVGELSYLAFSPPQDSSSSAFLYVRDLYLLKLPAELVVLSACETNAGEYRTGEGLVSLAKGFFHAGVRSVVATLWRVDDAKNADLMLRFFKNIQQGNLKDAALRKAKLSFILDLPHDEAHPAYWAAAVAQGEMAALSLQTAWIGAWWLLLLALLPLGYWIWKRRGASAF